MIGCWHDTVCLSVSLSVCKAVHRGAQNLCRRLKVVPSCSQHGTSYSLLWTLLRCRMYRLATKLSDRLKSKSRLQFETVNSARADHGYFRQRSVATAYVVRSAITATAEGLHFLVLLFSPPPLKDYSHQIKMLVRFAPDRGKFGGD